MIKWLEKTLGQELTTPRDFLLLLFFLVVLLPLFIYSVGLALWFFFYIIGFQALFLQSAQELSRIADGEIPFGWMYADIWSWIVRDFQNLDVIRLALGLLLLSVAIIGHLTLMFIILMIIRGIVRALWRLTNKIVKPTTR